jgi:aldose sugar dehydrogenase
MIKFRHSIQFSKRQFLLFFAVLLILIATFFAGANFYRIWPLGPGYYLNIRSVLGLPPPKETLEAQKAGEAQKTAEAQNAKEARTIQQTGYHKLKLYYFEGIPEGHLATVRSAPASLELVHVSLEGDVRLLTLSVPRSPNLKPKIEVDFIGTLSDVFKEAAGKVNDVFVRRDGSFLVSYTTANERNCASMKLDELVLADTSSAFRQKTIYQTHPCTLPPFSLHQTGGRIAEDSQGSIFFTVGDFGRGDKTLKDDTDFGKIIKLSAGKVSEVARGFRNPQGLFFDLESNRLYCTDHGPRGGDEINVVEEGENYGWPLETYGFNYDDDTEGEPFSNKGTVTYGRHDHFKQPIFAFIPDIGIGQLGKMPIDSYEFPNWIGDFFLVGMNTRSLYRLKIEDGRVVYVEPIEIDRLRDFIISPEGLIVASSVQGLILIRRAVEDRG